MPTRAFPSTSPPYVSMTEAHKKNVLYFWTSQPPGHVPRVGERCHQHMVQCESHVMVQHLPLLFSSHSSTCLFSFQFDPRVDPPPSLTHSLCLIRNTPYITSHDGGGALHTLTAQSKCFYTDNILDNTTLTSNYVSKQHVTRPKSCRNSQIQVCSSEPLNTRDDFDPELLNNAERCLAYYNMYCPYMSLG